MCEGGDVRKMFCDFILLIMTCRFCKLVFENEIQLLKCNNVDDIHKCQFVLFCLEH